MPTQLHVAEDNFKSFRKMWSKVENIGENGNQKLDISGNQADSEFRYFVNKYDSTCTCYLCKDIGEFKPRLIKKETTISNEKP